MYIGPGTKFTSVICNLYHLEESMVLMWDISIVRAKRITNANPGSGMRERRWETKEVLGTEYVK